MRLCARLRAMCVLLQFVQSYLADPGFFKVPLPMRLGLAATPAWLSHMVGNAVMDGDGVLLYGQARIERSCARQK